MTRSDLEAIIRGITPLLRERVKELSEDIIAVNADVLRRELAKRDERLAALEEEATRP